MGAPRPLITQVCADPDLWLQLDAIRAFNIHALRDEIARGPVMSDSRKVSDYLRATLAKADEEQLRVLHLDAGNLLLAEETFGSGSANSISLEPRKVFRTAIAIGSCGLILAHNHPSGNLSPSADDVISTRRIAEIGRIVGIPVLDHLIVTSAGATSMARLGLMGAGA